MLSAPEFSTVNINGLGCPAMLKCVTSVSQYVVVVGVSPPPPADPSL